MPLEGLCNNAKNDQHTSTDMYIPSQGGKRAVMSMCTYSNCSSGNRKGSTGLHVCHSASAFWHCMQDLDHSQICDIISGHTYLSVTSLMDALAPRWDRLCRLKKKVHHNDSGTKGHIFPVLVSYITSSLLLGDTYLH